MLNLKMINLKISDKNRNFIANRINNFHSLLTLYVLFGWLSKYHSKILLLLIPSIFTNWSIDNNNECCIHRIERYIRIEDNKKEKIGFIESKLKTINNNIDKEKLDKMMSFTAYISFLFCYYNVFM